MGEPSPGLARIYRMNMAQLTVRIERLQNEMGVLGKKLERLKSTEPQPMAEINSITVQIARLRALEKAAKERLEGKSERRDRRMRTPRR
ncbi:MAG TPA: hypothetical protein VG711_07195 [Phycisphaerales bacterium]|nr:hypothetical protein [Phycisphaerales bacterium]